MHVPYSMDDSEPDLYGGLGGHVERDDNMPQASLDLKPVPLYVFYSQEEMYKSDAFQHMLGKVLKCKERQIDELRVEILELNEKLERLLEETNNHD